MQNYWLSREKFFYFIHFSDVCQEITQQDSGRIISIWKFPLKEEQNIIKGKKGKMIQETTILSVRSVKPTFPYPKAQEKFVLFAENVITSLLKNHNILNAKPVLFEIRFYLCYTLKE